MWAWPQGQSAALRIELGPKDLEKEQVVFARRDDSSPSGKSVVAWSEVVEQTKAMVRVRGGFDA